MKIIRTKKYGTYTQAQMKGWGSYLEPCDDPEGIDASEKALNKFKLRSDFPKLPSDIISAIVNLFRYFAVNSVQTQHHGGNEVSVLLLRRKPDFKEWKAIAPKQQVSPVSVSADNDKSIDLLTGEEYIGFPPEGWAHAGSIH